MARRLSLPVTLERDPPSPDVLPSADDLRKRLGGPGQSEPGAGRVVRFVEDPGAGSLGVVLFCKGEELDVLVGDGWVRRTRATSVTELAGPLPAALARVADDARAFALLAAGARVRFQPGTGDPAQGRLIEKCRFGAIVKSDEGRVLGVGFRKLWPAPGGDRG